MGTGGCSELVKSVTLGIFLVSGSAVGATCQNRDHILSVHRDFPAKLSRTEALALARLPDHVGERRVEADKTLCPRNETVLRLAEVLDRWNVFMSVEHRIGKTTLCRLLKDYYLRNNRKLFLLELWDNLEPYQDDLNDLWTAYKELFAPKNVILVDEAQGSYGNMDFWSTVIKDQMDGHGHYINICLFSFYGDPSVGLDLRVFFTTAIFSPRRSVTLTPQPNKFASSISFFKFDEEARSYLFKITNGHPGEVVALVDFIHHIRTILGPAQETHCHNLGHRHYDIITREHMIDTLRDDSKTFRYLQGHAVFRSFPNGVKFTPEAAKTMSMVLEEGNMRFGDDFSMQACYKKGWIQRVSAEEFPLNYDVVVIPSRLHEKEVQYQDEFYRSFNLVAGREVPTCSTYSRTSNSEIDFYIPEKKWAVDLLRDNDHIDDHVARFKKRGSYYSWIQDGRIKDWVIINYTTSSPAREYSETRLWHAVFTNDCTDLKVYDHEREISIVRLKD
ncbi:hypothetical protein BDW62DRAFT_210128 [Aspergillus aurantiobrunneus]